MPALNSLVTQQQNTEPPNIQGGDSGQPSGLQGIVGQQQPQQIQAPSHQETVALLQHMSAFRRRWAAMLQDPEIGSKDMRGDVQDMMADMMSEDYASLPEVMGILKSIPTNPLQQRQWIEKHVQNDDRAMELVLGHRAQMTGGRMALEEAAPVNEYNRASLVREAAARYKANPRKTTAGKGIPVNG